MHNDIIIYRQILPTQCQALAQMGYRSIINLRPDAEAKLQPCSEDIHHAARDAHVAYYHLPCHSDTIDHTLVHDFAAHIEQMPRPVLVFCATGFRAKRLYQTALMQGLLA